MSTITPDVDIKIGSPNLKTITEVVLEKELKGTPMENTQQYFIGAGVKYDVDPLLMIAIGKHESGLGKYYSQDANDMRHSYAGVMAWTNGQRHLKAYNSWEEAVYDHARILREKYFNQGKNTIKDIWLSYAPLSDNPGSKWGYIVSKYYTAMKAQFSN